MKRMIHARPMSPRMLIALAGCAGLLAACGNDVALGVQDRDSGTTGTGGLLGTGGGVRDAAVGSGGAQGGQGGAGSGGTAAQDAPIGTGGVAQTGGQVGLGGVVATGGAIGTGGGTGNTCGGAANTPCPSGQFCDVASNCGAIPNATGTCVATGPGLSCTADYTPVCGCNGTTYSNDCARKVAGILKASNGMCGGGTGGKTGTGGTGGAGGTTTSTGGKLGTGGVIMDGGAPGSGGKIGSGGAPGTGGTPGTGGSTAKTCGGTAGLTCGSTSQFCDLASNCGAISDAVGTCKTLGGGCTADYNPVCGCDGKTYSNDCVRFTSGVLLASKGACPTTADAGATACAGAYLVWMAPGGFAGTGPAVTVCARGWADTWTNVSSFAAESPPSSATSNYTITTTQSDDLFTRLGAVDLASLPHPSTGGAECYPSLYLRTCATCAAKTLTYNVAAQLLPEMEQVWLWFDQLLGATATTNPRNYCRL